VQVCFGLIKEQHMARECGRGIWARLLREQMQRNLDRNSNPTRGMRAMENIVNGS
jgi:hypothetical protein